MRDAETFITVFCLLLAGLRLLDDPRTRFAVPNIILGLLCLVVVMGILIMDVLGCR